MKKVDQLSNTPQMTSFNLNQSHHEYPLILIIRGKFTKDIGVLNLCGVTVTKQFSVKYFDMRAKLNICVSSSLQYCLKFPFNLKYT